MRRIFALALTLLFFSSISAQNLTVAPQSLALFPASVSNLSIVDGEMYAYSQGLFSHLPRISGAVTAAVGDTMWNHLDKNLSYLVRNPRTGNIFFQTTSKSGIYECIPRDGKSPKVAKVSLVDARGISIEHPVFSEDGMIMIFSTSKRIGVGGSDLWYSEYDTIAQRWGRPANLGSRINSPGDETSPAFVNGFLLFASRNRQPGDSAWSLYATLFRADAASDDTARRNTIGLSPVQKLPAPINSSADDYELVADPTNQALYWLSRRKGNDALYQCAGALQCAWVHGRIASRSGTPLPNAMVRCTEENGSSIVTLTDAEGNYQLLLKVGRSYLMTFSADTCFTYEESVAVKPTGSFVADLTHDVVLDYLPMNTPIRYDNLFVKASADLSPDGISEINRLGEFLKMNPTVAVALAMSSAAYDDLLLDKMLSDSRIETIQTLLDLPKTRINCTNTTYARSRQPNAKECEIEVELLFE